MACNSNSNQLDKTRIKKWDKNTWTYLSEPLRRLDHGLISDDLISNCPILSRHRSKSKVVYTCFSLLHLAVESRDLSQAEKKITVARGLVLHI